MRVTVRVRVLAMEHRVATSIQTIYRPDLLDESIRQTDLEPVLHTYIASGLTILRDVNVVRGPHFTATPVERGKQLVLALLQLDFKLG